MSSIAGEVHGMLGGSERGRIPGGGRSAEYYVWAAMDSWADLLFQIVCARGTDDFGPGGVVFLSADWSWAGGVHNRGISGGVEFGLFFGCVLGCRSACDYDWDELFCAGGIVRRFGNTSLVEGGFGGFSGWDGSKRRGGYGSDFQCLCGGVCRLSGRNCR